jgi:hypothetical protein
VAEWYLLSFHIYRKLEPPEARLYYDQEVGCTLSSPRGLTNQTEKLETAVNIDHYLHGTILLLLSSLSSSLSPLCRVFIHIFLRHTMS